MSGFVLDASIALSWHFDDESDASADLAGQRSLSEPTVVPRHWFAEVANGLLAGERRRRTTPQAVAAFMPRLDALNLTIDELPGEESFGRLLPLARAYGLTVYDAQYLELAERRGLPLATLDSDLAEAARKVGVIVLGDSE